MVEISENDFEKYTVPIQRVTKDLYFEKTPLEKIQDDLAELEGFYKKYSLGVVNDIISQLRGKMSISQCTPMKNLIFKIKRGFKDQINKSSNKLQEINIKSIVISWGGDLSEKYENASIWIPVKCAESVPVKEKPKGKFYQLDCGLIVSQEIAEEFPNAKEYKEEWKIAL